MNALQPWKAAIEILTLWCAVYQIIRFFEGTRAQQVMRGIIMLAAAFLLVQKLELEVLSWLLNKLFGVSIIAVLVIFLPEIRHGLARLGQRCLFRVALREEDLDLMLGEIARALESLCRAKFGALIAIEKDGSLGAYASTGVGIDARVSAELLEAVFTPNNPLHDGAAVIQGGRVSAAGCLFPLAQSQDLSRVFGTRHRAALGLSEETDAVVIVVSEERQDISLAYGGRLYKDLSSEEFAAKAKGFIRAEE